MTVVLAVLGFVSPAVAFCVVRGMIWMDAPVSDPRRKRAVRLGWIVGITYFVSLMLGAFLFALEVGAQLRASSP